MKKEINKMNLEELMSFKAVVQSVADKYGKMLTTYAIMNNDNAFMKMSSDEKKKHEKHGKLMKLLALVENEIERMVDEYLD